MVGQNATLADVDLLLRVELKDFRVSILKRFIEIKLVIKNK